MTARGFSALSDFVNALRGAIRFISTFLKNLKKGLWSELWAEWLKLEKEFGLGLKTIRADIIPDNSKHYGYLVEYPIIEENEG